jgi:hypothetical protein
MSKTCNNILSGTFNLCYKDQLDDQDVQFVGVEAVNIGCCQSSINDEATQSTTKRVDVVKCSLFGGYKHEESPTRVTPPSEDECLLHFIINNVCCAPLLVLIMNIIVIVWQRSFCPQINAKLAWCK